jgi:2-polyprenyl-6-hydroxyphenyl methylase/3-demethylubiquinone-9 3-methyltransferase
MSMMRDSEDWLGGYPFEVATPQVMIDFYQGRGFVCDKANTVRRKMGCNEFVFHQISK